MASKKKKKELAQMKEISKHPHPKPKTVDIRRRVTSRAPSIDTQCTMKLRIYLSKNDEWFLHKNSCLDHCNHLPISAKAMAKRATEMISQDISMVRNLQLFIYMYMICTCTNYFTRLFIKISKLYDLNVAPTVISEILKDFNGDDVGTFLPKTLSNRNEKLQELLNMDKGILSTDSDGEKIIKYFEK
jgi:hypothetical protein